MTIELSSTPFFEKQSGGIRVRPQISQALPHFDYFQLCAPAIVRAAARTSALVWHFTQTHTLSLSRRGPLSHFFFLGALRSKRAWLFQNAGLPSTYLYLQWIIEAASTGAVAPEPPLATRFQPRSIRIFVLKLIFHLRI